MNSIYGESMKMMNYFCGMVEGQEALSLTSIWDHCQKLLLEISDTSQAGFKPAQNLSSGFVE